MEVSVRVENVIKQMMIGAVDHDAVGCSTKPGGLKGNETSGTMANMDRACFLTIAIWGGFSQQSDLPELTKLVLQGWVIKQPWFDVSSYLKDTCYQRKVNGMVNACIKSISTAKGLSVPMIADKMGVTKQAFHKTWSGRYKANQAILKYWLEAAAQVVHNNSK